MAEDQKHRGYRIAALTLVLLAILILLSYIDTNQIIDYSLLFVERNPDEIIIATISALIAIFITLFLFLVSRRSHKKTTEELKELIKNTNAEKTKEDPEKAQRTTDSAKGQNLGHIASEIVEATKLQISNQYDKAISKWLAIAKIANNNKAISEAYFSAAYLIQEYKEKDGATVNRVIDLYSKSIELHPAAYAYNNRGNAKNDLGRHDEAIADFNEAIRLKPDFAKAYNNRGNVKNTMGRFEEAIVDLNVAIKLKPDLPGAYYNRGTAKIAMGKHEEAIADYSEAIKLDHDLVHAYLGRGAANARLDKYDEAIEDYSEAIKLDPDLVHAYLGRGLAKSNLGRFEEAIEDFNEIIKLDPGLVSAYINRGIANTSLGKYDEARADLRKALELEPGNELAKLAIAEIEAKDKN